MPSYSLTVSQFPQRPVNVAHECTRLTVNEDLASITCARLELVKQAIRYCKETDKNPKFAQKIYQQDRTRHVRFSLKVLMSDEVYGEWQTPCQSTAKASAAKYYKKLLVRQEDHIKLLA